MKTSTVFPIFLFVCVSFSSLAQIEFQKGYIIDNDGRKIECFIKDKGWIKGPDAVSFKKTETAPVESASLEEISGFGIPGVIEYRRLRMKMDISEEVSLQRTPMPVLDTIFAKVVVEGPATLLQYGNQIFFYKINDAEVKQFIYKKYKVLDPSSNTVKGIGEYPGYQQQLLNDFKCGDVSVSDVKKISFSSRGLGSFFKRYNRCVDPSYVASTKEEKRDFLLMKLAPGVNFTSMKATEMFNQHEQYNFGSATSFRIGVDAEFILPFRKNTWGIVIEPAYSQFKGSYETPTKETWIEYRSIEAAIGFRYHVFALGKIQPFVNALLLIDFPMDSKMFLDDVTFTEEIAISRSQAVGFGVGVNAGRFSVEGRYYTSRNLTAEFQFLESDYNKVALIGGFRILKK